MNHVCYLFWNSKSISGFQNAYSSCKGNMRGQTSHGKENNTTEHISEKSSISYRLQCWSHTVIERKEIHWSWHIFFGLAHELCMNGVSFPLMLETFSGFSAKAVLTNFFIGASSHDGMLSAFAFEFQMVVNLQGFTLCEWNETRRRQQNCLAAFHHVFSFLAPVWLESWHTV